MKQINVMSLLTAIKTAKQGDVIHINDHAVKSEPEPHTPEYWDKIEKEGELNACI